NNTFSVLVNADGQPMPQTQAPAQQRLDNLGNQTNILFRVPKAKEAELVMAVADAKKKEEKFTQKIPLVSEQRTVELFPEGGDLVAGLENRVYYRVAAPQMELGQPEARVALLADKVVIFDSQRERGLGSLTFVPDLQKSYELRVQGPAGVTE